MLRKDDNVDETKEISKEYEIIHDSTELLKKKENFVKNLIFMKKEKYVKKITNEIPWV